VSDGAAGGHRRGTAWRRVSSGPPLPPDPAGEAVAEAITEILQGATVDLVYSLLDAAPPPAHVAPGIATASGRGPAGWRITCTIRLGAAGETVITPESTGLMAVVDAMAPAALRTASQFRNDDGDDGPRPLNPSARRALRDTLAVEVLAGHPALPDARPTTELIGETLEYLIELSGTRVEAHDLTHGVVIVDVFTDTPRLRFDYPADLRAAKRAPLLFDGQRSLLLVDTRGHPRFELQRHRLDQLRPSETPGIRLTEFVESGSFVAETTRRLGGLGFFLRTDRNIWVFVDGRPLLVRRREHWSAFPLELAAFVAGLIEGGRAADIVAQAAYILSAQGRGAILAVVRDRDLLDGIVSPKDRYDLRDEFDRLAMRPETRLHHLIDAQDLDQQTLAGLAALDGATIVDRDGNLLAYGAIVASSDSQQEGARTAAAKTLSQTADVAIVVSQDGDITVFRDGAAAVTLLGRRIDS
jgi:DisA bacterial checkpoint controller nucleotide-binding